MSKLDLTLESLPINTKFTYNGGSDIFNRIQQGGCCGSNAYWAWDVSRDHPLYINITQVVEPLLYTSYNVETLPEDFSQLEDWYKFCNHIIIKNEFYQTFLDYLVPQYQRELYLKDRWQIYINDSIESPLMFIDAAGIITECIDIGNVQTLIYTVSREVNQ